VKIILMIATALMTGVYGLSSGAAQEPASPVLQSLPAKAQKEIEETRASCRSIGNETMAVTSGDDGLIQFLLGGTKAVLIDNILLCGECYKGYNCSNRGTRDVRVYALLGNAWRKVPFLETADITGDIFVSYLPGKYRPEGQELNALVVNLFIGNKECPTRRAGSMSAQSWEARTCVVRWNGIKFTYKPL
jgi:hypothetical protein